LTATYASKVEFVVTTRFVCNLLTVFRWPYILLWLCLTYCFRRTLSIM